MNKGFIFKVSAIAATLTVMASGWTDPAYSGTKLIGQIEVNDSSIVQPVEKLDVKYVEMGYDLLDQGRLQESRHYFQEAVKLNEKNQEAWMGLATVDFYLGQYKAVVASTSTVIKLASRHARAHFLRGAAWNELDNLKKASSDLEAAMASFKAQGQKTQATETARALSEVEHRVALRFADQEQYEKSLQKFARVLELNPESIEARCERAAIYYIVGMPDKALADLNEAVARGPLYEDSFLARGNLLYLLKDYYAAIADLSRAVAINPRNADTYYLRSQCYIEAGYYVLAQADLDVAAEQYRQAGNDIGLARTLHCAAEVAKLKESDRTA